MGHAIGRHQHHHWNGWLVETLRVGGKGKHDNGQIRQLVGPYQAEIAPTFLSEGNDDGQHGEESKEILHIGAAVDHLIMVRSLLHHRRQGQHKRPWSQNPALGQLAMPHTHGFIFLRLIVQIGEFQAIDDEHLTPYR